MDARAKSKALFRAKLNAQKQGKQRIDSPLVRYNDNDQPVCRVCDVIIKSEALWPAHLASRKHHEAIDQLKANASVVNPTSAPKPELKKDFQNSKPEQRRNLEEKTLRVNGSSALPPDFFDIQGTKRPKTEETSCISDESAQHGKDSEKAQFDRPDASGMQESTELRNQISGTAVGLEASKQVKGALPEGFFDNKDADLRARGIVPVKLDVKDEYKEYEKLIKGDLQEIDNRLEEEEIDAAELIEEEETVEQRACKERLELLRSKKLELRAAKSAATPKDTKVTATTKKPTYNESSSDSEDDRHFKIDWRAKRL